MGNTYDEMLSDEADKFYKKAETLIKTKNL